MKPWVDVATSLPPEDTDVLVCGVDREVTVACRFDEKWLRLVQASSKYIEVTHWMDFPDPPERQ